MYDYMSVRIQVLECEIHGPTSEFYLGLCSGSEPRSHLKKNGVQTGTIPSFVRVFFFFLSLSLLFVGIFEKGRKEERTKKQKGHKWKLTRSSVRREIQGMLLEMAN